MDTDIKMKFRALVQNQRALPDPATRRRIRQTARVPMSAVAEFVGVTHQAVSLWETGQREPSAEFLAKYVEALEIMGAGPRRETRRTPGAVAE